MLFIAGISACFLICFVNAKPAVSNYSSFIKTSRDKFPSYVDVGTKLGKQCGGVLLDKYTVLTSAISRCHQKQVLIMYTDHNGEEKVISSPVAEFIPHEEYDGREQLNEIAIIKLADPIEEVKGFIHYARLPNHPFSRKTKCSAVGFGAEINGRKDISGQNIDYIYDLHYLKLNLAQLKRCNFDPKEDHVKYPNEKFLCGVGEIRHPSQHHSMFYYVGGPLYCVSKGYEFLYGVNVGGYSMQDPPYGDNALFLHLRPYMDWIKKKLHQ